MQSEEEFGEIIIKTSPTGAITRLRDVARIELGSAEYSLRSLLNNKQAVAVPVFQAPGSNAIEIADQVRTVMEEIKATMPQDVDYEIVYDTTQFVRASIEAVIHTLLEAIALVVIVVIIFLQTWRASIIPLIAVPVSIVGTFAIMQLFGFSINALSLFGLVLAIGIVVDDAIVVVENVERNIENGLAPARSDLPGDDGSLRPDHRDRAGTGCRLRAACLHLRPHRPVLQAVRPDHRHLDRHLGLQLAHPVSGPGRSSSAWTRCAERPSDPDHGFPVRLVLPRLQCRLLPRIESL